MKKNEVITFKFSNVVNLYLKQYDEDGDFVVIQEINTKDGLATDQEDFDSFDKAIIFFRVLLSEHFKPITAEKAKENKQ